MLFSIIVPTYNEAQNLPILLYLIDQVRQDPFLKTNSLQLEVIIIEDNSEDQTRAIAHKLTALLTELRIIIIERQGKMGIGSAYREGVKRAKGEFVVIMDADLSHHPKYITHMIKKQHETNADIVASSRYIENGGVEGWTFFRKLTSRVANFIASWTLGSNFSDLTGGFRLYRKEVLQSLMAQITTIGYAFQMQTIIRAWKTNKKIEQEPIIFVDRIYGKSKLGSAEVFRYLVSLGKVFLEY